MTRGSRLFLGILVDAGRTPRAGLGWAQIRGHLDTSGRVKAILVKALLVDPELVRDDALLVDDLNIGSLDRFELIMDLETEFGLEIREEDLVGAKTVGDIVHCLDAQIKGTVAPLPA